MVTRNKSGLFRQTRKHQGWEVALAEKAIAKCFGLELNLPGRLADPRPQYTVLALLGRGISKASLVCCVVYSRPHKDHIT